MDRILLRFRDLTQGIQTIDVHNSVVAECGKVYWGWWKKEKEPLYFSTFCNNGVMNIYWKSILGLVEKRKRTIS